MDTLNSQFNNYSQQFSNSERNMFYAEEIAKYCFHKNINPGVIPNYIAKLTAKGYHKDEAWAMIFNYVKAGQPLSALDNIPIVPPIQLVKGPNGETLSRVIDPRVAGVSFKQAQVLNYENMKNEQKLSRRQQEIEQDLYKQRKQNEEEERHAAKMMEIQRNATIVQLQQPFVGNQIPQVGTVSGTENLTPLDYATKFVAEKHIVCENKRRDTDDVVIYMWNEKAHIYLKISQNRLRTELKSFWPENLVGSNATIEQLANTIRYKLAPALDDSELQIADGNQTFFPNGYFDIKSGNFCPCDTSAWFHNFCIPYDYDENASNPDNFDQILSQLFDGDETKIKLSYQIIGALISEVRSLKEIYVFQGVTNSGKTTLASIILKLLDKHERKKLNSVTEITDDALKKLSKSVRVVCIKDSGQEALKVNSVSYLKSYASGDFEEDEIYFTMLLQTNNPIYSDKSGNIEKALHDRFLVLPFAKDMKTALGDTQVDPIQDFLDNHFEHEKCGIVKKALRALHEVMANRKRFVHRFPLNACVGGTVRGLPAEDKSVANAFSPVNDKNDILRNFIEDRFEVIDLAVFQAHPKEGISAQHLVTLVSEKFPNIFGNANSNSLGKILRQIHVSGKVIETSDFENKRYYNLRPKFDADRQTDR